jgi:peptidoglycan/LPS O-acetylase OafA/YrhL
MMGLGDSLAAALAFLSLGAAFFFLSFGLRKARHYVAACFLSAAIAQSLIVYGITWRTGISYLESAAILVAVLLVLVGAGNYARLQLREERDAEDPM